MITAGSIGRRMMMSNILDGLLGSLRDWLAYRDMEEARDLRKREVRLMREVEAGFKRRDDYDREYQKTCAAAWANHLTANGVEIVDYIHALGNNRYKRDGKFLWEHELYALGAPEVPEYNPPRATDKDRAASLALDLVRIQMQGYTAEEAVEIKDKYEAEAAARIAWAEEHHWPRYRFESVGCDVYGRDSNGRDQYILTNEEV
jgi:hypothetical protein